MHDPQEPPALSFSPIGTVHTRYRDIAGMPIQPAGARGEKGTIAIRPEFCDGLRDLAGFERIILIYAFHRCTEHRLAVVPFLDTVPRGIFATRSPKRPNGIGLSVVRLTGTEGCTLHIEDADILDGTPLLDIKPYVPEFDAYSVSGCGWLEKVAAGAGTARSDDRFR